MRKGLPIILLSMAFAVGNVWADNLKRGIVYRAATKEDIVGTWSMLFVKNSYYKFRYAAITNDGRIGWVAVEAQMEPETGVAIFAAIEKNNLPKGAVEGWKNYKFNDGRLTVVADGTRGEIDYSVKVVSESQSLPDVQGYKAVAGDLLLQKLDRVPAGWTDSAPPHFLPAIPLRLRRLVE